MLSFVGGLLGFKGEESTNWEYNPVSAHFNF